MLQKQMKIAILNIYQNNVNRGAETFVSELGKRLSKKHSVDIISNVNYLSLFKRKYDVIIPTNGRCQAVLVRIISLLTETKVLISGQSGIGFDDRINLYTFPNYFIALSEYALEWAKKVNPFVNVIKISNGVDLIKFKYLQKSKLLDSKNMTKTVLAVGAFTKEKGHDLTIKAVSKLKNTRLVIVGGGGEKKDEIIKLGNELLKDRFEILSTTNDLMPEIYSKADLFVFPTVPWESFGIAVVEAMACGLGVVSSNDPIRREIIGNAGLFVDPNNTEEYAKALERALNTDWGTKPRKQAEKFNWDLIADKYEKILTNL